MSTYDVGFWTKLENNRPRRWYLVTAKASQDEKRSRDTKSKTSCTAAFLRLLETIYWRLFVILSIFLNIFIFITYFWFEPHDSLVAVLVMMHSTCFVYWIDFIGKAIKIHKTKILVKRRKTRVLPLLLDAVSLVPLSAIYLIIEKKINKVLLWELRIITLIRFYRIPYFFKTLSTSSVYNWVTLAFSYLCYFAIFIISMSNIFICYAEGYSSIDIHDWNKTIANKVVTSLYYSIQVVFNVGYGDITPIWYSQLFLCLGGMCFGAALTMGVFPGIIGSAFMNLTTRREQYRHEFEGIKHTLKRRKIDPAAVNTILDNMTAIWKYTRGFKGYPPIHILPPSLQREILFDINFGLLSHSVVFSTQPRHFLRSVTMFMKNFIYLPGDIILEPGPSDLMICIASGIVEVLSEENDDTPLFSLTHGSVIGEMSLFFPLVRLCVLRASTYVELQVLKKVHLTRLAPSYPEIFRSMRESVSSRLKMKNSRPSFTLSGLDYYRERKRRRETKFLLQSLRLTTEAEGTKTTRSLYTLSENIPRVKNYPLTLIRARPWILRPDTSLTKFWEIVVLLFVLFAIIIYPIWASFRRNLEPIFVLVVITRAVYIIDIYMECTIAIENKDNYTYIVTIRGIIARKLKTVGFYLDILAAYELSVYAPIILAENIDYMKLLLMLNALLKSWRVYNFMKKQENNIRNNLFFVVTVKYALWIILVLTWGASLLYLEARPGEYYIHDRWFYMMEIQEVENQEPNPRSIMPETVTFYFTSITMLLVGYGDVVAKSVPDCIVVSICILSGCTLAILWVVETSTAQKHLTKIRTGYQEGAFAIERFIAEHDISQSLQKQVKAYMQLQWNYDKGYSLKKFTPDEFLLTLQRHIIVSETAKNFFAVPVFRGTSEKFLKLLAKLCKIRVLPPNQLITAKGSVVRAMYILESGYCRVSGGDANTNGIISGVNAFDYIEMILGEEKSVTVETITHVRVISLTYGAYLMAITAHPSAKFEVEDALRQLDDKNRYRNILAFKPLQDESSVPSLTNKTVINVYKYHKGTPTSYWDPFQAWGKFKFFEYIIFPFVLMPDSLFLKIWMTFRILSTVILGFIAPIQFSILWPSHPFMYLITALQIYTAVDMYLMLHIAYYNEKGLLVFHPAKTSVRYLKGLFLLDLISVIPYYWLQKWILPTGVGNPLIRKATGMIIIIQLYKFFQACYYLEEDILRKIEVIKVLKLLPLLLMVINLVTGFIILLDCYLVINKNVVGLVGSDRLATELMKSTKSFCLQKSYGNITMDLSEIYKMYLTTFYWVTTTITVCGFGDIVPQTEILMIMVIVMVILGIFFFTFMFANITSSIVNTNILISAYRKRMLRMILFMKDRNVSTDIQKRLIIHYEYNWMRKEGLNPQGVLYRLNAALREKIITSMYEGTIKKNPVLDGYEKYIVEILSRNVDEIYFLQGETIVKHKNIYNNIYLIYRGKVNVITPNGKHITSLGCGAMFGNISNKSFLLSPETVIAAENVDLLSIDTKTFFLSLQGLPGAMKLLQTLTSLNRNYIREKISEDSEVSFNKPVKISKYRIPSTILQRGGSIHLRGNPYAFRGPIVYVFNKLYRSFVILPDTVLSVGIDVFFSIMAFLSYILTTYTFAFQDFRRKILICTYLLDLIFLFGVYLDLHKTESDKFGENAIDIKWIQKRYFKSQKFICDVISNIPLEVFMFAGPEKWRFKLLSILRLNRTLRLYYLYAFFKREQRKLMTNRIVVQLCWTVITISLLVHTLGCILFFSVCPVGNFLPLTWITDLGLVNPEIWELYVFSVYHVIVSTTTAGLQVNQIYSIQGLVLSTAIMISCRYAVVLITSVAVSAVNANSYHLNKFQQKFHELKWTFKRQNLSDYIFDKLIYYLRSLWASEDGKQIPKFIVTAPYCMKCDVMFDMFGKHLSNSYVFATTNIAFRRQLASHLRRFVYFTGDYILQQGDIDYTMYFIESGEVSVLTIHPELMETVHYTLVDNYSFGIRQGLILGKAHQFSYRAETRAEVLHLTYKDWQHLLKYFPEDAKKINLRLELMT